MRVGPDAAALGVRKEKKLEVRRWQWATLAAMVVLVLGVVAVWHFYFRLPPIEPASKEKMAYPLPDKPSIAVLPFVNMSKDTKQDYLSDGFTEDLITTIAKIPELFVISRQSTFTYKGKPVKVQTVAEDLGVRYVLEGSIQRSGDQLRVNVQLIDAIKGHHLWGERYDRKFDNLFKLKEDIILKVANELLVELVSGEYLRDIVNVTDDPEPWQTKNLEAWETYWLAQKSYRRYRKEDNARARDLFKKAYDLDPNWYLPLILIGWTHQQDGRMGYSESRKKSFDQAAKIAHRVITIYDKSPTAHHLLGSIHMYNKEYEKAKSYFEKALSLNPNAAHTQAAQGIILTYLGKPQEAILSYKKAMRLSPFYPAWYLSRLGVCYHLTGQYDKAIETLKQGIKRKPDQYFIHVRLAAVYSDLGRDQEARAEATEVLRIKPDFTIEAYAKANPFRNSVIVKRRKELLRKAGLPNKPPLSLPDKPSIAVLPFVNMSGDPEQEHFGNGIADQIINSIAKIPYITVISRNSSFAYKGKSANVQQIAGDLGVHYILEGSFQRDNKNVRINTQLIDAKTGGHLWAENYDRKLDDIFSVQDEICKNIMVTLQVKLTLGEMARMEADTVNVKAYKKYLEGLEHYHRRTKEDALAARQLFQEAIALDPEYAMAYLQVGWTYLDDIWLGMIKTPSESIARAEAMVQKAVSIHGLKAGENALLTGIHLLKKNWGKAIAYGEKAVELGPNYSGVQSMLGYALSSNGQYEEAIQRYKRALQLNPSKKIAYMNSLAFAYLYSKQYEKAISTWNETLERNPDFLYAYLGLTITYWLTGSEEQARQAGQQVLRINPKFSVDYMEKRSTIRDEELKEKLFDAMRKAGLK